MNIVPICPTCGTVVDEDSVSRLCTPIEKLGLSNRVMLSLERGSIFYVEQIAKMRRRDLLRIRGIGANAETEIAYKILEFSNKKLVKICKRR